MKDFLNVSGAVMIAIIGVIAITFPPFVIFLGLGYMFLKEQERNKKPEDKPQKKDESKIPETKD